MYMALLCKAVFSTHITHTLVHMRVVSFCGFETSIGPTVLLSWAKLILGPSLALRALLYPKHESCFEDPFCLDDKDYFSTVVA